MDQDATWYYGKFLPMSIVDKRSPISATFEHLYDLGLRFAGVIREKSIFSKAYTQGDSDVISSLSYASCFPTILWGKRCEMFAILTSLS